MILNVIKTDLIKNFIKENGLTIAKFCELCKISPSTLYRIFNGKNFILVALFKIACIMKVRVCELIVP